MKITDSRHFNTLGKMKSIASIDMGQTIFNSDFELLRFYLNLINKGTLKYGSAGYKRTLIVRDRVVEWEKSIQRGYTKEGKLLFMNKNNATRRHVKEVLAELEAFDEKNRS